MMRQAGTNGVTAIFGRPLGSFLFRRIIPCSGNKNSLIRKRTGNLPQALQIFGDFTSVSAKTTINRRKFVKIPCYFPCSQGISPDYASAHGA
jgi:hypothetical protein